MTLLRDSRTPPDHDDQPRMDTILRQVKEVITIAGDQDHPHGDGMGKDLLIRTRDRQSILQDHDLVTMPKQDIRDGAGNIMVQKELHASGAWHWLRANDSISAR